MGGERVPAAVLANALYGASIGTGMLTESHMLALHLLQSALVHVNTLLMQQGLAEPKGRDTHRTVLELARRNHPVARGLQPGREPTAGVLVIFRFCAPEEVSFDVDLRELQGQERLEVFCGLLRAIGRWLGKPVLMDPDGDCGRAVLGFDVATGRS